MIWSRGRYPGLLLPLKQAQMGVKNRFDIWNREIMNIFDKTFIIIDLK
jgi:hypothetical protein